MELKGAYPCHIFISVCNLEFIKIDLQNSDTYKETLQIRFSILALSTQHSSTPSALTSQHCQHSQQALFRLQRSLFPQNQTHTQAPAYRSTHILTHKNTSGRKAWEEQNHSFSYWNKRNNLNSFRFSHHYTSIYAQINTESSHQTGNRG